MIKIFKFIIICFYAKCRKRRNINSNFTNTLHFILWIYLLVIRFLILQFLIYIYNKNYEVNQASIPDYFEPLEYNFILKYEF